MGHFEKWTDLRRRVAAATTDDERWVAEAELDEYLQITALDPDGVTPLYARVREMFGETP